MPTRNVRMPTVALRKASLPFTLDWIPAAADRFTPGRTVEVDTVVFHTTTASLASTIATFQGGPRLVSAHFIVDIVGHHVVQMVRETDTSWGAGNWPMNQRCINIEHVDNGNFDGIRPDELYETSIALCLELRKGYTIKYWRDHRSVVSTHCPGTLDTDRIVYGVMNEMGFDPRTNAADLAFLDQRIRDIVLNEPQLTGYALRRALAQYGITAPAKAVKKATKVTAAQVRKGHGRG